MQDAARPCPARDFDLEGDFSLMRKLDGISDQVHHHLAEAAEVAAQDVRHFRRNLAEQFQPFFVCAYGDRSQGGFEVVAQAEIQGLQVDFPRLDLGEVKNVIDHGEKCIRRQFYGIEIFPLLWCQLGLECEIGHSDHAIEGGADFVAHICQELALGLIGDLGSLLRRS